MPTVFHVGLITSSDNQVKILKHKIPQFKYINQIPKL